MDGEARSLRGLAGANMTVIYSTEYATSKASSRPTGVLPLLVILFIVSYGILTMLVFEQGQTIESQRGLIREMLKDSTQLAALKGKMAVNDRSQGQNKLAAPAQNKSVEQGNPAAGANGSDAKGADKDAKRPGKAARSLKTAPGKPASDLEDVRRSTRVI
ncbi:MAG: hypothetical protein WBX02_05520 [Terriglobales bacterium]